MLGKFPYVFAYFTNTLSFQFIIVIKFLKFKVFLKSSKNNLSPILIMPPPQVSPIDGQNLLNEFGCFSDSEFCVLFFLKKSLCNEYLTTFTL